jgi:eukaryotic-like serine/threonine-protein kinase
MGETMDGGLPATLGVREGDVISGKYRVDKLLGQGGMGVVVLAHHLQLDERVALKLLLPEALGSAETIERFVREARAAVRIKNEHVGRVTDVGTLDNGAPYMVMEYLEGEDLARWLKNKGALPIEQAVEFVLHACVAVADAHALGIVHRDLKPANLFCVRRSDGQLCIKVLDFGISKLIDVAGGTPSLELTKTNTLVGSPLYMSPEQMQLSRSVDARTDIWALGVVLFELIAGRPPFQSDALPDLVIKIANEPPPPLRALRPDVPAELEKIIGQCLEKDAARRYANVADLAVALLPFAPERAKASVARISGIVSEAAHAAIPHDTVPSPLADTMAAADSAPTPPARKSATPTRSTMIGGGILVALAALGASFALLHGKDARRHEGPTPPPVPALPELPELPPPTAPSEDASALSDESNDAAPSPPSAADSSMASLAGGTFKMADRGDSVTVRPFSMDVTEVTVDAYAVCVKTGQCTTLHVHEWALNGKTNLDSRCNYGVPGHGNHPVNCVDFGQATAYCHFQQKRLPTEEEWEWAARGGSEGRIYPWGNTAPGSNLCWSGVSMRNETCPVGSNPKGDAPGGIHDLAGNVSEWTSSNYDRAGMVRVTRGGSFPYREASMVRAAMRHSHPLNERSERLGFRCVR